MELALRSDGCIEASLTSEETYANPCWDVTVRALVTGPDGHTREREAFWDGEGVWRIRVDARLPGSWRLRTEASATGDGGLHGQQGELEVPEPAPARDPLSLHGPVRVAESRTHLAHADGTPFFWLADTAWNGVLKAEDADWDRYLSVRREQGFTAIQAVIGHWRAFPEDLRGERAFTGRERIRVNPAFYRRLDGRIEAIAAHGLVPALVQLWALREDDPGTWLPEADAIRLARYQVARYGHLPVVWILGGDGRYTVDEATTDRWRRIGRGVFGDGGEQPVTLHPSGRRWIGEDFREEPWFDFISYQSGHGSNDETLSWLAQGPPATEWQHRPQLPVINQEPCYEAHTPYHRPEPFTAYDVRRALYWSLLNAPTAGVTYGHHGIWPWLLVRGVPLAHARSGEGPPWHQAIHADGARSVTQLRSIFNHLEWWRLQPDPELLVKQAGTEEVEGLVLASRSGAGDVAVLYLPRGGGVTLQGGRLAAGTPIHRVDPRDGTWYRTGVVAQDEPLELPAPSGEDWLFVAGG